jgi:hypothetical protein
MPIWNGVYYTDRDMREMIALRDLDRKGLLIRRKPAPKRPRGRRPLYSVEAWRYANDLRQKHPEMKHATLRKKCLEKFHKDEVPSDLDLFRRWLNHPRRADRAN